MYRSDRPFAAAALLLLSTCLSGCATVYQCETTLNADGSVERAIYQPLETIPESARRPELWKEWRNVAGPPDKQAEGWQRTASIRDRLERRDEFRGRHKYVAAWGRFASPLDIPGHFERKAPEGAGLPASRLTREYTQTDYVFVTEHRWRETLTESIQLSDMRKARDDFADFVISLWHETFLEAVGKEYDDSSLLTWLRAEGRAWFAEVTDLLYFAAASDKNKDSRIEFAQRLRDICARHGLVLPVKEGRNIGATFDKADESAAEAFFLSKFCQEVRSKKTGKNVDPVTAARWLGLGPKTEDKQSQQQASLFGQAFERVKDRRYGGHEKFLALLESSATRFLGLYQYPSAGPCHFQFTLAVPGEVVATNGELIGANRVRWQFDGTRAYPLGYAMECRYLTVEKQTELNVLQVPVLENREVVLQFHSLVQGQEHLIKLLRDCRVQHSLAPLTQDRESRKLNGSVKNPFVTIEGAVYDASDADEVRRISQLLVLLQSPPTPANRKPLVWLALAFVVALAAFFLGRATSRRATR